MGRFTGEPARSAGASKVPGQGELFSTYRYRD